MIVEQGQVVSIEREPKAREGRLGRLVIFVMEAAQAEVLRDLDEHRPVFQIDDLRDGHLRHVDGQPKNIGVRFTEVHVRGHDEEIHEGV